MARTRIIASGFYPIYVGTDLGSLMENFLQLPRYKKSRHFVLVDTHTREHCLQRLLDESGDLFQPFVIEVPSGEEHKTIRTAGYIWNELIRHKADRHSLFFNLGGGVISDLGGFAASTFKRGIRYINIPTSLIGQVDAAIGGKVGIDYEHIKNQVGLFANPQAVIIDPAFLETLPPEHLLSGYAEVIKYGLVHDAAFFRIMEKMTLEDIDDWLPLVQRSAEIKAAIVRVDPLDRKYRRVLNFGHTIGHALESASLKDGPHPLSHGSAVAAGMICEAFISFENELITSKHLQEISSCITRNFAMINAFEELAKKAIPFLYDDKKNEEGRLMFSLLSGIGHAVANQEVGLDRVHRSFEHYLSAYDH